MYRFSRRFFCHFWVFSLCLIVSAKTLAADKKVVIATYDQISSEKPYGPFAIHKYLFEKHGYLVEFAQIPAKRMPYAIKQGYIDAYSSSNLRRNIELEHLGQDGLIQAQYPEIITGIIVYYKMSEEWQPSWPPQKEFIEKARGASMNYNYLTMMGFNMVQVGGYEAGFKMINYGRADYWVDNIPTQGPFAEQFKSEADGYKRELLTFNELYLVFPDNDWGRELKEVWDNAFAELYENTALFTDIYLENIPGKKSMILGIYLDFVRKNFPELPAPQSEGLVSTN